MRQQYPPLKREDRFDRVRDDCWLVRFLSLHTFLLLFRSMRKPLEKSDMFNVNRQLFPEENEEAFMRARSKHPEHSLKRILFFHVLFRLLFIGSVLAAINALLTFAGPLVIKKTIAFLNNKHSTYADQQRIHSFVWLWVFVFFIKVFLNQSAERHFIYAGLKSEQTLAMIVHQKIIKLSISYRLNMKRGSLYAFFTNDIKAVTSFINSASSLIAAPTIVIAVQILVFLEFHQYGFVFLLIACVGIILQLILAFKMVHYYWGKAATHSARIGTNIQMITSIRDLKLLGWEDFLVNKNINYREKECKLSRSFYTLSNLFDLMVSMAPMIIVILTQMLKKLHSNTSITTAQLYLLLSYVSIVYSPSKAFLSSFVKGLTAMQSLKKIEQFYASDEIVENTTKSDRVSPGEIRFSDFIANSQDAVRPEQFQTQGNRESGFKFQTPSLHRHNTSSIDTSLVKKTRHTSRIQVPFELKFYKGERIILLSDQGGGKSSFLRAITGHLKFERGVLYYNGKIGLVTQRLWFRKQSIKQNILFGQPYDKAKLLRVYKSLGIQTIISALAKGDETIIQQNCKLTASQKIRISLARALYYDPDIVILDEPFSSIDQETASVIYDHIRKYMSDKTVLIATQMTGFIRTDDKVLVLYQGVAVEYGPFSAMLHQGKKSYLFRMLSLNSLTQNALAMKQQEERIIAEMEAKRQVRRRKLKKFLKTLLELAKNLTRQEIQLRIIKRASDIVEKKAEQAATPKRQPAIPFQFYKIYLTSAPFLWFVFLFLMLVLAQASKVFADWWLGMIKVNPYHLTDTQAMAIYIASTVACGIFLATQGFLTPYISVKVTKTITTKLSHAIAYSSLEFLQPQNPLKLSLRLNRDIEELFNINILIQNITKNLLLFTATVVLVSLKSPTVSLFITLVIIILNLCILKVYINADRQLYSFRIENVEGISNCFEQAINGIDLFRIYNKIHVLKESMTKTLYRYTVQQANYRYATQGMVILCEITSLWIIASASVFAVQSRFKLKQTDIAIVGASITFCLRMTGVLATLVRDATKLDNLMKLGVVQYSLTKKQAYDYIDKNQEKNFDEPLPPNHWPRDGSIEMTNVCLGYQNTAKTACQLINLKVQSGQKIALMGKGGSGKGTLLAGLQRILLPKKNIDGSVGTIKVGGVDTRTIGRKYYSEHVMILFSQPLVITGTIRQNLDPFNEYTQTQMRTVLERVALWDLIEPERGYENILTAKLEYMLTDGGAQISFNHQQRLNIARVLLRRPQVLMGDCFTSSLDVNSKLQMFLMLRKELPQTTMVFIPESVKVALQCEKAIYMGNGRIKQYGTPQELIKLNKGFAGIVKRVSAYIRASSIKAV